MKRSASHGRTTAFRALAAVAAAATATLLAACATTAIDEQSLGLSKASVFATVTPVPYRFDTPEAGRTLPPAEATPPMISHDVTDDLPITARANACIDCHVPRATASPARKKKGKPVPADHLAVRAGAAAGAAAAQPVVDGRHYTCMACHAPQTGVAPLVVNTAPAR